MSDSPEFKPILKPSAQLDGQVRLVNEYRSENMLYKPTVLPPEFYQDPSKLTKKSGH